MTVPDGPAQRHRLFAQEFADVVAQVGDWAAPTPVREWTAVDVPAHLIEWLPGVLEGATGIRLPQPSVDPRDDPATAWREHAEGVQAVLDDAEVAGRPVEGGPFGGMLVGEMIDRLYTADVFMHRWDLARAAGLDPRQDPDFCAELLTGMSGIEELLRNSGQFGPPVRTPDDASPAERLAGFLGRDPAWRPRG